jgi:TrmH family RNA methyltransferase
MELSDERRRLIARLHRRRTREREGLVLLEGIRAVAEAVAAGAEVRFAVASPRGVRLDTVGLLERLRAAGVPLVDLDADDDFADLADTETPQGVLAVCVEPTPDSENLVTPAARLLVLDGVQDPGNVGTLIRTAAAFGLTGVVALDGTVDPWNAKALRASAGTAFRLPVATGRWDDWAPRFRAAGTPLWYADAGGRPVPDRAPAPPWALVVGSEGAGVRAEVRSVARGGFAVPMPGGTESLNAGVAGAILLYALTRGVDGA